MTLANRLKKKRRLSNCKCKLRLIGPKNTISHRDCAFLIRIFQPFVVRWIVSLLTIVILHPPSIPAASK
jgi:hypothetical protein